jgi:hypothetical protein
VALLTLGEGWHNNHHALSDFASAILAAIRRPGIQAILSYWLLPRPHSTPMDMNQLRNVIQGQNIDAVVATRLVKVNKTVSYIPGQAYPTRTTLLFTDITARSTPLSILRTISGWIKPHKSKLISIQRPSPRGNSFL